MAIHELVPGIEVVVCIEGIALKEYQEEKEKEHPGETAEQKRLRDRTVTRFIECQEDKNFTIKIRVQEPHKFDCPTIGFPITVDGDSVDIPLLPSMDWEYEDREWEIIIEGPPNVVDGKDVVKLMTFAKLTKNKFLPDDMINMQKALYKDVGEIMVEVRRYSKGKKVKPRPINRDDLNLDIADHKEELHEKAVKGTAKSHGVVLGTEKEDSRPDPVEINCEALNKTPLAIFVFNYRSLKGLRQEHIPGVPLSPSPEPEASPAAEQIDLRNLDKDVATALQAYIKKEKPAGVDLETWLKVKREPTEEEEVTEVAPPEKRRKAREKLDVDLTKWKDAIVLD